MNRQPTHEVVDTDTGKVVGTYISQITAYRAANRRNRNCGRFTPGTVRYIYRPIPAQGGAA